MPVLQMGENTLRLRAPFTVYEVGPGQLMVEGLDSKTEDTKIYLVYDPAYLDPKCTLIGRTQVGQEIAYAYACGVEKAPDATKTNNSAEG